MEWFTCVVHAPKHVSPVQYFHTRAESPKAAAANAKRFLGTAEEWDGLSVPLVFDGRLSPEVDADCGDNEAEASGVTPEEISGHYNAIVAEDAAAESAMADPPAGSEGDAGAGRTVCAAGDMSAAALEAGADAEAAADEEDPERWDGES